MEDIMYMERLGKWKVYIFIYKTSVKNKTDKEFIANVLDAVFGETSWTIDLTDEDKVLRVESLYHDPDLIKQVLAAYGFFCEQMHY
ncbi:hypothetical protein [Mucilaginibacter lappiensis]|jgi:hypothetical protein|uniref:hypothetical protein n=1 Tax=Mucilaginibacter lappiensis TaxID=354630 RepID=UPI003D258012